MRLMQGEADSLCGRACVIKCDRNHSLFMQVTNVSPQNRTEFDAFSSLQILRNISEMVRVFSWPHSAYSYYSNAFLCEGRGRGLCGFAFFFCPSVCPSVQMRPLVMLHINDIRMTACSTDRGDRPASRRTQRRTRTEVIIIRILPSLSGRKPIFLALPPLLFPPQDAAAIASVRSTLSVRGSAKDNPPLDLTVAR